MMDNLLTPEKETKTQISVTITKPMLAAIDDFKAKHKLNRSRAVELLLYAGLMAKLEE